MSRGGSLASMHTVAEAWEVWRQSGGRESWIGLRRKSIADLWEWNDGSSYGRDVIGDGGELELWHSDLGGSNLCARWQAIDSSGAPLWDDAPCEQLLPFICRNAHWNTRFLAGDINENLVLVSPTPHPHPHLHPHPHQRERETHGLRLTSRAGPARIVPAGGRGGLGRRATTAEGEV